MGGGERWSKRPPAADRRRTRGATPQARSRAGRGDVGPEWRDARRAARAIWRRGALVDLVLVVRLARPGTGGAAVAGRGRALAPVGGELAARPLRLRTPYLVTHTQHSVLLPSASSPRRGAVSRAALSSESDRRRPPEPCVHLRGPRIGAGIKGDRGGLGAEQGKPGQAR